MIGASPCEHCDYSLANCAQGCETWRTQYLQRQDRINAYARKVRQPKAVISARFCYAHPDDVRRYLQHSPCEGCQVNNICNTPCAAYLRWWDARMGWVRRILNAPEN